ncbi:MAG TPA: hypothetical protein VKR79_10595 [Gaiellaceae bacterium]|nr:hypothetical protein [Gaiellaceae bacterium]
MRRVLLAPALVAALSGCGGAGHAVPKGFRPETAAAFGSSDIWVLGQGDTLIRSTDGGAHFARVAFPPLPTEGSVPTLEFASARLGYAYVPRGRLFVTRNGGRSWSADGHASSFGLGGGFAYVVSGIEIKRSPVARDAWKTLGVKASLGRDSIAARGSDVWLLGAPRRGQDSTTLAISTDRGRTFATRTGPCFYDLPGQVVPAGGNVVWAVCPSGMMAGLFVSTNGGRSFGPASFHDPGGTHLPAVTNGAEIFPLAPRTAILSGGGDGPLLRTTDAGKSWTVLHPPFRIAGLDGVEFTAPRFGLALVQTSQSAASTELWRTTDGGATWRAIPLG